ncbi:hypothetical protein AWH56_020035 [Anaerobacillus isosaccharinicus]|uniref:Uncharacterized protein n=1 Tax=Anaerobacillus isosaccharinicus TaxID=1532552 RepID=A0A1S2KYV9_9BACI|nr:hypothetical protein [Anaerobacillus isosaccharinicus]MBA5586803.1 hypothetical protein [Anaerobacillus isosaccharinicus]QOY34981.1 hypothetical protein AWH56_020035 [Anaerobacillus isosaccharinicus]
MSTFIIFLYHYFDFTLMAIFIVLLALFLSLFVKTKSKLIAAVMVVLVAVFFLVNHMQYTTFPKLVSNQLNEKSQIRDMTITINDNSNGYRDIEASVTIEDEEIIEQILTDFESLKLKRDINHRFREHNFTLSILVTNETKKHVYNTSSQTLYIDDDYINNYRILSATNHLKTIEALIENEEIEWQYYND